MRLTGLDPVAATNSEILVLGTFPGPESLKRQQYYADSGNAFWRLVKEIIGVDVSMPYEDRCNGLIARKLALWDVIGSCLREGALDKAIREPEPTDLAGLLEEHPSIRVLLFNGGGARDHFFEFKEQRRWKLRGKVTLEILPSSSGTNTHCSLAEKAEAWMKKFTALGISSVES